ncbi:phosphotransferase family protein [Cryptosporangium aurantiacum]|uniref:Predicted kinase, aminoglycoside phosphotransferase (APT) family n=1 Tax=Cryptosporangium aurantiacum TaxID=134849 RepID=A0A1M7RG51_9ACTN|nr:phosphotransferase [Cryptosporangium aurantiacum]SHN45277.1 Predicted kinase, aminoglycoside phosphotransferase (APT) family [Cryptosporangium aurantiacum]
MTLAPSDEAVVLSPTWLTSVLGETVADVVVTQRLETVATKTRFTVTYASGGVAAFCAKGYFNPTLRRAPTRTEADFYSLLAEKLPVRTPPCVHSAVDPDTGHALILMEDLVAAGAQFLDPLIGYRASDAAGTLDQLAQLHAATWGSPNAAFPPRLASLANVLPAERLQQQLDDGRAPDLPPSVRRADRLLAAVRALAAPSGDECLVHGDLHTGNVYRLADGSPGLIDWQVVQYGRWALDVSYHLAAVLDPGERQRSERDLLDHYLDRLGSHGAAPPSREDAWHAYRASLPYGFYLWAITRAVDRPVIEHLTARLGQAVADHRSLDLLGV